MNDQKARIVEYLIGKAKEANIFNYKELNMFERELNNMSLAELSDKLPEWHDGMYRRVPVPVREWITSPDYMDLGAELYPRLVDDLEELFEGGYSEAVIDGSIGWGKSYFTATALLRMMYEVSCLKNPQLTYGIARGTAISFVNAAIKEKTAKEVVFKYCKTMVQNSPYFNEEYKLEKELEAELVFQDNVRLWAATSSESGVIGQNLFGGALDELNFFRKIEKSVRAEHAGDTYDHAKVLWRSAIRRMQSRFERQGKIPGVLLLVSSNMYPDDFTIWRRELAEEKGHKIFHRRYSQWETKPNNGEYYSRTTFQVSLGTTGVRPRIIRKPSEDQYDAYLDDTKRLEAEGIKLIDVPDNYLETFEEDVDMAVREVAGYPTLTASPFFRDVEPINRAIERGTTKGLKHPYSQLTTNLEDGSHWIKDNLDWSKRYHRHFAHVDLALNGDAAGLTVVRLDGMIERETMTISDMHSNIVLEKGSTEWVPKLTQVLSLRMVAPPGRNLQLARVRHVLIDLINDGFLFTKITYDQFNSEDSIQYFQQKGLDSKKLSVDRKMDPYEVLRNILQDDLLDMYPFPHLENELQRLEIDTVKRKIDHPPKGSKDVSDTLAGAVFNAVTFALENPALVTFGETEEFYSPISLSTEDPFDISWLYG